MEKRKLSRISQEENGIRLSVAASEGIRGYEYKLKCNKLPLNVRKKIFLTVIIIEHWKQRG